MGIIRRKIISLVFIIAAIMELTFGRKFPERLMDATKKATKGSESYWYDYNDYDEDLSNDWR